jgi:hypothetical protein
VAAGKLCFSVRVVVLSKKTLDLWVGLLALRRSLNSPSLYDNVLLAYIDLYIVRSFIMTLVHMYIMFFGHIHPSITHSYPHMIIFNICAKEIFSMDRSIASNSFSKGKLR